MNTTTETVAAASPSCAHLTLRTTFPEHDAELGPLYDCVDCDEEVMQVDGVWITVPEALKISALKASRPALTVIEGGAPKPTAPGGASVMNLAPSTMLDEDLATAISFAKQSMKQTLDEIREEFGAVIIGLEIETRKRLEKRGARSIANPRFSVELVDEYEPYRYDLDLLRAAATMLPAEEAAKIVKFVPEMTETVAAHYVPGAAVSIAALVKKYGDTSEVGKALSTAMTRNKTGDKLVVKDREPNAPISLPRVGGPEVSA